MRTNGVASYLGGLLSYLGGLKLYYWHMNAPSLYDVRMALDEAFNEFSEPVNALIETSYSLEGSMEIIVPETRRPENVVEYIKDFSDATDSFKETFLESFQDSIIDDIQSINRQLLLRLERL